MDQDAGDRPFFRQPRTILAAAVLAVVLIVILVFALGTWVGKSPTQPGPAPTALPQTTSTEQPAPHQSGLPVVRPSDSTYDSACGLSGGSITVPTDTPTDVTWQNVNGWYLPVSKSAGPARRTLDGPWSCFARTPTGAVLAAYTIAERVSLAANFKAVVTQQIVPGVGQTTLLSQGQPKPSSAGVTVPRGFVVDRYTNDDATITFYLRQTSLDATCSIHVQWFGGAKGDWLLRPESDGGTSSGCIQGAPSRFVPWGPTS